MSRPSHSKNELPKDSGGERELISLDDLYSPKGDEKHKKNEKNASFSDARKEDKKKRGAIYLIMALELLIFATVCILSALPLSLSEEPPQDLTIDTEKDTAAPETEISPDTEKETQGALTTPEESLSAAKLYRRVSPSVVTVKGKDSHGSGFAVAAKDGYGYILAPLLSSEGSISVTVHGKGEYDATLLKELPMLSLSLLRINTDALAPLAFGSSDALCVGDPIISVGTPLSSELWGCFSEGAVGFTPRELWQYSADGLPLKRTLLMGTTLPSQTVGDGAPLVNTEGEVVGVAKRFGFDGAGELCLAIPSSALSPIISEILAGNEPSRELMAGLVTVPASLGAICAETEGGILIKSFSTPDCSAARALKTGDLLTELDGEQIKTLSELDEALSRLYPGDRISLTVLRFGQYLTFTVELI